MVFIFGICISLFLAFLLLLKRGKSGADKVLFAWLIILGLHQSLFYLDYSGDILGYGFLTGVIIPFPLLHGPFLFMYTSHLIEFNKYGRINNWIHFLPFLLVNVYLIDFYSLPTEQKLFVFANEGKGYETFIKVNWIMIVISGLAYTLWNLALIKRHQKKIRTRFSNIDRINLKWLQYLIYGLLSIWIIVPFGEDYHIFFAATLFVSLIGVFGIQQGHIFSNQSSLEIKNDNINEESEPNGANINIRYAKSGLTEEKRQLIKIGLLKLIDDEKLFLEPELSLSFLSSRLDIQSNYVSQLINEEFGKSFYDYINSKRVNEFKHRIALPKYGDYKLIEVAYDCGFNSKSTFNRVFKRMNGVTPSEYLKTIDVENLQKNNPKK